MQNTVPWLTLSPDAAIDLQLHTTNSDGVWTPEQLVEYLVKEQFALVAITDHEGVDMIADVQRYAAQRGLAVLAAVEMTTHWEGEMADLLCYGFDPAQNELGGLAQRVRRAEKERAGEILEGLKRLGYLFTDQQEVLREHGGVPLNADDIFTLMRHHGYAPDEEAFSPAYQKLLEQKLIQPFNLHAISNDLATVVEAAHRSGAVCVLAHPGRGGMWPVYDTERLDRMRAEIPIDGVEAYYPAHSAQQVEDYLAYARQHNLVVSSGSDSHGGEGRAPIKYAASLSRDLLQRVGVRVS